MTERHLRRLIAAAANDARPVSHDGWRGLYHYTRIAPDVPEATVRDQLDELARIGVLERSVFAGHDAWRPAT